jgi:hypothetical protein
VTKFKFHIRCPEGVPEEEWALAQAIQAAKGRDLHVAFGDYFYNRTGDLANPRGKIVACCAVGALRLARVTWEGRDPGLDDTEAGISNGNDQWDHGMIDDESGPEWSIGYAFVDAVLPRGDVLRRNA